MRIVFFENVNIGKILKNIKYSHKPEDSKYADRQMFSKHYFYFILLILNK